MPKLHINDNGVWKAIDAGNTDQLEGKTKAEVLQEAADLAGSAGIGAPNILINTDVLHAVNQRAFNGNWGNLQVGSYGYDRWLKADAITKGQIVESGNFIQGATYTLGYSEGDTRTYTQVTAPATGHWLVKVPFIADKLDLYLGSIERPWTPEAGDKLSVCQRYYNKPDRYLRYGCPIYTSGYGTVNHIFNVAMRKDPKVVLTSGGGYPGTGWTEFNDRVVPTKQGWDAVIRNTSLVGLSAGYAAIIFTADAELTLGDL